MQNIDIKKISYRGWENCIGITNRVVDLIVTADVGPRIIRYGFNEGINQLCEIASTLGVQGGKEWRLYGGHRLWHSPEDRERTYEPDNAPVQWEEVPGGIKTIQDVEKRTGIQKEMVITLSEKGSKVTIKHRLINAGLVPVTMSVWSITAMAAGGMEVVPVSERDSGLLPNRLFVLWPYSNINDPRVTWGDRYIVIRHDPAMKAPFKLGIANEQGWAAYCNRQQLFIKYHDHTMNAPYPDFGSSYETYTNDVMLEMETLSPLTTLKPRQSAEHREEWELFDGVTTPSHDEDHLAMLLSDKIRKPA